MEVVITHNNTLIGCLIKPVLFDQASKTQPAYSFQQDFFIYINSLHVTTHVPRLTLEHKETLLQRLERLTRVDWSVHALLI